MSHTYTATFKIFVNITSLYLFHIVIIVARRDVSEMSSCLEKVGSASRWAGR